MSSEMRSGFDPERAASHGLQVDRQHQLLLLQQQLLEEDEKNDFFQLDSGPLYSTRSSGSSSTSDSDSTMNGNYASSSNIITNGFYSGTTGLGLSREQQQPRPALNHEISLLNNLHRDATSNLSAITNQFHDHSFSRIQNATNSFNLDERQRILDQNNSTESPVMPSGIEASMPSSSTSMGSLSNEPSPESISAEDSEIFTGMILRYINGILMEEDIEDKFDIYPEHPDLLTAEKPFYDIIGEEYHPSADETPPYFRSDQESLHNGAVDFENFNNRTGDASLTLPNNRPTDEVGYHQLQMNHDSFNYVMSSFADKNSAGNDTKGMEEYPSGLSAESELFPVWQFQKGLEEARKFLPSDDKLVINFGPTGFHLPEEPIEGRQSVQEKPKDGETKHVTHQSRGKKNHNDADLDVQEGRSSKQSATYTEAIVPTKMFDEVLLSNELNCIEVDCGSQENLNNDSGKSSHITHSKGSGSSKGREKRLQLQPKKEVVDLQTLLIHCAQCVSVDDHRNAYEWLKQIRKHADPHGDAHQRLAHYFADGLEARLAGTGSQISHSLIMKRIPIADVLKAYKLDMDKFPLKRIGYYFSNRTIRGVSEKAARLHIIDFGIYYGFQWPCLMQRLCERPGGPPKLRITAIDTPVPGFRPTELIDETGRRLAYYAQSFNIPFEYHAIATSWERVREEDLNIDKDELLIVNCMFRMKSVADETVLVDSPRDAVLNMIRKLNPAVFIHGIINGSYSAPFFVTRFREALFYFSALYDMIETTVPREDESRQLIEKVILGREALNVISCEGSARVERPETYKQWQARHLRAGFVQLPLNPDIFKKARAKYKASYHKDFVIDEDNNWLLQGWKGKILVALSTWKSNISS